MRLSWWILVTLQAFPTDCTNTNRGSTDPLGWPTLESPSDRERPVPRWAGIGDVEIPTGSGNVFEWDAPLARLFEHEELAAPVPISGADAAAGPMGASPDSTCSADADAAAGTGCAVAESTSTTTPIAAPMRKRKQAVNVPSAELTKTLSPRTLAYAMRQRKLDEDNDDYTPNMSSVWESTPELGEFIIGELLGAGLYGSVFAIPEHPKWVIKYQSDCEQLRYAVHPLLTDFWLSREAAAVGVSLGPSFISPGTYFPLNPTLKSSFRIERGDWHQCRRMGAVIRFMVMPRVGTCLDAFIPKPGHMDPAMAIMVGIQVLTDLRQLHAAGIVHGDIHRGNVCWSMEERGVVKLIDYGLGTFSDSESDVAVRDDREWSHIALTPWQVEGRSFSRRDDVYKVIHLVAQLMLGDNFLDVPRKLSVDGQMEWKRSDTIFQSPSFDPIEAIGTLNPDGKTAVKAKLARIVRTVVNMNSVTDEIPYTPLLFALEEVLEEIRGEPLPVPAESKE